MKIVIEGMDGAGKSTVAKELARRLNIKYADNLLFGYLREEGFTQSETAIIRRAIDICSDNEISIVRAWFYGFANMFNLTHYKDEDLIIDRHFLTNYYYNGDESSRKVYKVMQDLVGKPDIVILLRATAKTRMARISNRNQNDKDLKSAPRMSYGYDKMEEGAKFLGLNYKIVDTDDKDIEQVVEEILQIIKEDSNYGNVLADNREM